jgi:hypothetical protein
MLSLTVFGISAGLSYLGYCNASEKYAIVVSAKDVSDGGSGIRYCTGFLRGDTVDFKGTPLLSLETKSYDIFQKINISNGSACTTNIKRIKDSTFDQAFIQLNEVDISNLVPKFHQKFAVKLDETYEASAPVDLINSKIRLGTFRVSIQNEALAGVLKTFHGVKVDPQTSYIVVGPFNGKCFYNTNRTLICENTDIRTIRAELRMEMKFWEGVSSLCLVGGVIFGWCEIAMVSR